MQVNNHVNRNTITKTTISQNLSKSVRFSEYLSNYYYL